MVEGDSRGTVVNDIIVSLNPSHPIRFFFGEKYESSYPPSLAIS